MALQLELSTRSFAAPSNPGCQPEIVPSSVTWMNLSPANAQWFYGISQPGDVVQVTGTPVPLTGKDTDIPDWTIPWSQWGE